MELARVDATHSGRITGIESQVEEHTNQIADAKGRMVGGGKPYGYGYNNTNI
jgi:hypothetical protein